MFPLALVAQTRARMHKNRTILALIAGALSLGFGALGLALEIHWKPFVAAGFVIALLCALTWIYVLGVFRSINSRDAALLLDERLASKERFATLEYLSGERHGARIEERNYLERDLQSIAARVNVSEVVPLVPPRGFISFSAVALLVWATAALIFLWPHPRSAIAVATADQVAAIRDLLERTPDLPASVKESFSKLADALEKDSSRAEVESKIASAEESLSAGASGGRNESANSAGTKTSSDGRSGVASADSGNSTESSRFSSQTASSVAQSAPTATPSATPTTPASASTTTRASQSSQTSSSVDVQQATSTSGSSSGKSQNSGGSEKSSGSKSGSDQSGGKSSGQSGSQKSGGAQSGQSGSSASGTRGENNAASSSGGSGSTQQSQSGSSGGDSPASSPSSFSAGSSGAQSSPTQQLSQALEKIKEQMQQAPPSDGEGSSVSNSGSNPSSGKGQSGTKSSSAGETQSSGAAPKQREGARSGGKQSQSMSVRSGGSSSSSGSRDGSGSGSSAAPSSAKSGSSSAAMNSEKSDQPAGKSTSGEERKEVRDLPDGNGPGSGGIKGDKAFTNAEIKGDKEQFDTRYTGSETGTARRDGPAQSTRELSQVKLARPELLKDNSEQPIPLEYKDVLQ